MSKTYGKETNFRVVITPRGLGQFGSISVGDSFFYPDSAKRSEAYRDRCRDIEGQVKRHVDEVGSIDIECDREEVCSHCGSEWTEASDTYNGGCCDEDEAGNPELERTA